MKIIRLLISILCKVLIMPLYIVMYLIDNKIIERISKRRFTLNDARPHILIIILAFILYYGYHEGIYYIDISKADLFLQTWLNFQGILFATSLAVTTFILSIFDPKRIKNEHPNKCNEVDDIIDDLRRANMIIFVGLVFLFIYSFSVSIGFIRDSSILIIIAISFSFWSLGAIESIIKGIFELINI